VRFAARLPRRGADAVDPHEYCRQKAVASGSSFYYSFLFLPPDRRRAIIALYAFCREVDDVVDEVREPGVARAKLMWWREEIGRVYHGKPHHPVALALAEVVGPYDLKESELEEIIEGMAMDLEYNAYPDFDALKVYCHRVAGMVGQLSAKIFGYQDPRTNDYAEALGIAFQLTNIIRDVGEDARRGRVYLPLHELAEYGVTSDDLVQGRETDNFRRLIAFQIARAEDYYDRALALLPAVDRKPQRPGLVMAAIYRTLLREIEADGSHVLTQRTSLTPIRKLWIAWKTWLSRERVKE
jgi:phytoene synthase